MHHHLEHRFQTETQRYSRLKGLQRENTEFVVFYDPNGTKSS